MRVSPPAQSQDPLPVEWRRDDQDRDDAPWQAIGPVVSGRMDPNSEMSYCTVGPQSEADRRMTTYALTYPQLMGELLDLGISEEEAELVRRAYDAAVGMTRDLFRPSGASFLGHLTRTASIALHQTRDPVMVSAALLHATYALGGVGGPWARLTRRAPRSVLRGLVGSEIEEMVFAYDCLPWTEEGAVETHIEHHEAYSEPQRRALVLRIANELEDQLDAALCFRAGGLPEPALRRSRSAADLARAMGLRRLGEELAAALAIAEAREVPVDLRTGKTMGYRSSWRNLPELAGVRRRLRAITARRRKARG